MVMLRQPGESCKTINQRDQSRPYHGGRIGAEPMLEHVDSKAKVDGPDEALDGEEAEEGDVEHGPEVGPGDQPEGQGEVDGGGHQGEHCQGRHHWTTEEWKLVKEL